MDMSQQLIAQIANQQSKALDLLSQSPLTPTRRKLIERHLAINEKLMEVVCRPSPSQTPEKMPAVGS
jgi:hypothetical protein